MKPKQTAKNTAADNLIRVFAPGEKHGSRPFNRVEVVNRLEVVRTTPRPKEPRVLVHEVPSRTTFNLALARKWVRDNLCVPGVSYRVVNLSHHF